MITSVTRECPICGKEIKVKRTYLNTICIHDLSYFVLFLHAVKEHRKRIIPMKYVVLCPVFVLLGYAIRIIMGILCIITLIPWILHEICE